MQPGRIPDGRDSEWIGSPRGELKKMSQERSEGEDAEQRAAIMDSMLDACGESGYRQVTVEDLCHPCGGSGLHFYRHFASKADCFAAAYRRESHRLTESLAPLEAGPLDGRGLQKALERLASFVAEEPLRAKALFVEVHVAGGDALGIRREVFERLSHALDKAGRETGSRHSAPPIAGEFMINVIDQAVSSALVDDDAGEFSRVVPELTDFVCLAFGAER
jgi:AcrR family transcriptional regulator